MLWGHPFSRKQFLMEIGDYIKAGWGTYSELIQLTMLDLREIKIGIESRNQEEKLLHVLGG